MGDRRTFSLRRLSEPRYAHLKLLLLWPVYLLVFLITERFLPRSYYHPMYHPLDDRIPFQELFVIPYVFWYVFMIGSILYTLRHDTRAFRRQGWFMIITFGTACLVYLIYPNCQQLRPQVYPRDNLLTSAVKLLHWIDTPTGVCPSLHVCGAIGSALGLSDTRRFGTPLWKIVNFSIALLISLSTMFIKQHSVVDVFWAVILSLAAYVIAYRIPQKNRRPLPDGGRM